MLKKVRGRLSDVYHSEFLANLIAQATDKKGRFAQKPHRLLKIGDIVLLKDTFLKPSSYPMAIVRKVNCNSLGEVTSVEVLKGSTREIVSRHVTSLICLLPSDYFADSSLSDVDVHLDTSVDDDSPSRPPKRAAALIGESRNKNLAESGLV